VGGATGGRTAVFAVLPSGAAGSGGSGAAISTVAAGSISGSTFQISVRRFIEAMPRWLQPVSWSLPMTFYVEGVRAVRVREVQVLGCLAALGHAADDPRHLLGNQPVDGEIVEMLPAKPTTATS